MSLDDHIWSRDRLFIKARLYVQRAAEAEPGSGLEALWSLLGFEFLARAAIADVHPALLADPRDGEHILYAFGHGSPEPPKSVPVTTVFRRCQVVIPGFTERDFKEASGLINLRNSELHSGSAALEEISTSRWMPQYYRLSEILLKQLEAGLGDLFSENQASSAVRMIDALAEDVESDVKQRIADAHRAFEELGEEAKESRGASDIPEAVLEVNHMKVVECPACGTRGLIRGEMSGFSQPQVGETDIERTASVLPTAFSCKGCGLRLGSHAEMLHAGLGDQYAITEAEDPIDYYGIDIMERVDPADFYEPDYGND